jgi:flavodoxin
MRILVVHESRSGHTAKTAEAVGEVFARESHDVSVVARAEVGPEQLDAAALLVVGTWVEGFIVFGVKPARAMSTWVASLPALGGKPVALFCTYAVNPKGTLEVLRRAFEEKGARVVATHAANRRHLEADAEGFARRALAGATGRS